MKSQPPLSKRAGLLAERIMHGAHALGDFAEELSDAEWKLPVTGDGRTIGVVVHHVASSYPTEVALAQVLASGRAITGVTKEVIDQMNAEHAKNNARADKQDTLTLLRQNSGSAADTVRSLSDEQLENSAPVSLNADAPLTAQFFIEDHALRHSYHHLAKIRATLNR